jgi:hypothetical protein
MDFCSGCNYFGGGKGCYYFPVRTGNNSNSKTVINGCAAASSKPGLTAYLGLRTLKASFPLIPMATLVGSQPTTDSRYR